MLEDKFPTILGTLLLVVGIAIGALSIQNKKISENAIKNLSTPKEVKISNITDHGFSVNWITDKKATGYILLGESKANTTTDHKSSQKENETYVHGVNVDNLQENTSYYFKIISNEFEFLEGTEEWSVKTAESIGLPEESEVMVGKIVSGGSPMKDVSVFVNVNGSSLLSTLTDGEGIWTINLSTARDQSLKNYIPLVKDKTPVEIYAQSGAYGISYARTTVSSTNIVEPMELGQFYVLKPVDKGGYEAIPDATVNY